MEKETAYQFKSLKQFLALADSKQTEMVDAFQLSQLLIHQFQSHLPQNAQDPWFQMEMEDASQLQFFLQFNALTDISAMETEIASQFQYQSQKPQLALQVHALAKETSINCKLRSVF